MTVRRLLAKSSASPDAPASEETLDGHLSLVGRVAIELADRRGSAILEAIGLDARWRAALARATLLAAVIHDLGKASDEFQRMVRGQLGTPQAVRHEVLSLWLLTQAPALDGWLFDGASTLERLTAIRAAAGHHLSFTPDGSLDPRASGALRLRVHSGHQDFARALARVGTLFHRGAPPPVPDCEVDLVGVGVTNIANLIAATDAWWQAAASEERRLAAAVAALLIAADVCGSAIGRGGTDAVGWASRALDAVCSGADLMDAAQRRLGGRPARPFQEQVAVSPARLTLVTAGCGSGKTAAAYLWAGRRLAGRKLFFCYPTTGTATEGFLDYALPEFEVDAALVHSRAELDLERILDNGVDGTDVQAERARKHRGLGLWTARVAVCTADAVLGLTQNNRTGLFGFPALATAGFVFDEIHLYDDRLFGSLLAFLEALPGAPVLLMTATLQPARREAILALAERLGEAVATISGPPELEQLPRYEIQRSDPDAATQAAFEVARRGGRVLWVANTVDRAVAAAARAEATGLTVEPYHSRYRYIDRLDRHRAVIDGFQSRSGRGGFLAATTQVCEVSLDISADLLVTELAPPAALIQRLGRLNRWAGFGDPVRPALILEPQHHLPYQPDDLAIGGRWLAQIAGRPISQSELHAAFEQVMAGKPMVQRTVSAWLDEAWTLEPRALRATGVTITVIREEDLPACFDGNGRYRGSEIQRYALPMPFHAVARESRGWRQAGAALIAPAGRIEYDERWGGKWR